MDLNKYYDCVDEAADCIKKKIKVKPRIAVILSAGLGLFTDDFSDVVKISSGEIPHYPLSKAEGHAGQLYFGHHSKASLAALAGRFHYYEGHPPQSVVFPYFVLARLGVKVLITTNAVGGINKAFKPGDIVVINDHINMMGINPLFGIATQRKKDQFTNMTNAYDVSLRKIAQDAADELDIELKSGVLVACMGPSYETKAEIRMFRQAGADVVGMSTVPEIIAANFLGMRCLAFSCIANCAADLHEGEMSHAEVLATMNALAPKMVTLLTGVVKKIGKTMC